MRGCLALCMLALASCGTVHSTYTRHALDATHMMKHVAIATWADAHDAPLDRVMAAVTRDLVRQYKNYMVYQTETQRLGWSAACSNLDGVIAVRATEVVSEANEVRMQLAAELYDCHNGALLWRTDGETTTDANDDDLRNLTQAYVDQLGPDAARYAAPAFVLLKDLVRTMPNPPPPTDDELLEMIELESAASNTP